jgi:hypothetical protein
LPEPPWPTSATLRILAVGNVFTRDPPRSLARSDGLGAALTAWRLYGRAGG